MDETGPADERRFVPLDRYPGPAVSYTLGGPPTIEAANDAFESAFGATASGTPAERRFERLRVPSPGRPDSLTDLLGESGPSAVPVETEDTAYVARIQPPADTAVGYVFFDGRTDGDRTAPPNAAGASRRGGPTESADREVDVDRVASVLSHDLRNPLDVAKARLRAGRETGVDEHFQRVENAHRRMERIIEDVLTLSRGGEYVTPEDTAALGAVAESAWETVDTGDATLTVADDLPTAVVDRDGVERLFENLFRNAVEHSSRSDRPVDEAAGHSPTGDRSGVDEAAGHGPGSDRTPPDAVESGAHPEVTVGRLDGEDEGFYVADDGPGIPPTERAAVFDPGYSSHEHGTGLGLSIVKRIADCHGWAVEATDGRSGARFEFRGIEPDA